MAQYDLQHQLGHGRFAEVYHCVERYSGVAYAVKRFDKALQEQAHNEYSSPFREASIQISLHHPNILELKEVFEDEAATYLILELAPAGSLHDRLRATHKLAEATAKVVCEQLFEGLRYIHRLRLVHRDIKPANILLISQYPIVKICDFGIAQAGNNSDAFPGLYGTPAYMAPEVLVHKEARSYTPAVDVWSAGIVLYICLCGYLPFTNASTSPNSSHELLRQMQLGHLAYPSPHWDFISDAALLLISSMLVNDARQRITMDECLAHEWLKQSPIARVV